jgi:hypothetical protein
MTAQNLRESRLAITPAEQSSLLPHFWSLFRSFMPWEAAGEAVVIAC